MQHHPSPPDATGIPAPRAGAARWLRDPHVLFAMWAALPVWIALALWFGPQMRAPAGWWAWLSFSLVQPLLEEGVFRGLLQGQLILLAARRGQAQHLGPISWANALTTLAFVALHLLAQPMAWALAVAGPSLVLGHLRERLGSVWPAVVVHAVYNTGFGLTAWLAA